MSTPSRGLSLANVLTMIVVLGLLAALLLPAILYMRPPMRRSVCQNNLKQLTLAIHQYHNVRQELPVLYAQPEQGMSASWLTVILPYWEQHPTYDVLAVRNNTPDLGKQAEDAWVLDLHGNEGLINNFRSPGVVCEARRGPMLATYGKVTASPTDYCVVNSSNGCWFGSTGQREFANGCIVDPVRTIQFVDGKTVPWRGRVNFGSIADGLSYTAILGEKHFYQDWKFGNPGRKADGQSAADGPAVLGGAIDNLALFHARRLGGLAEDLLCGAPGTAVPLYAGNEGDGRDPVHLQAFGSWHPRITLFAMADGNVRAIKNTNRLEDLSAMGGRNEGQPYTLE